jgi:hypothetical protein
VFVVHRLGLASPPPLSYDRRRAENLRRNIIKKGIPEPTMNLRSTAVSAALLSVAFAIPAVADDMPAALQQCAAVSNDGARLACYDQLAAQAKTVAPAPAMAAAPSAQQPAGQPPVQTAQTPSPKDQESWFGLDLGSWFGGNTPPAAQTTPQQFGSEYIAPPPPKPNEAAPPRPLDSITAKIADVAFNPFGRFTVFLDNGQIWQQMQGDTDQARFPKKQTNEVTISRGMLGSYNLVVNDKPHVYKVKRIK